MSTGFDGIRLGSKPRNYSKRGEKSRSHHKNQRMTVDYTESALNQEVDQ